MIFSVLAFIALILSICIKERKKSLFVQSLNCLFEAIYGFIINAFTGAVLSIVNFVRTFIFIQSEKISKRIYLIILIIFESVLTRIVMFNEHSRINTIDKYITFSHEIQSLSVTFSWRPRVSRIDSMVPILGFPFPRSTATKVFNPTPARSARVAWLIFNDLRRSLIISPNLL